MQLLIPKKILKCILDIHYVAVVLETGLRQKRKLYLCDTKYQRMLQKEV
jgi:hypothetical protein